MGKFALGLVIGAFVMFIYFIGTIPVASPVNSIPLRLPTPIAVKPTPITTTASFVISLTSPGKIAGSIPFSGGCLVTDQNGNNSTHSVEGTTPVTYSYTGSSVSCNFQNQWQVGSLSMEIRRDGTLVQTEHSDAAYGIVSAAIGLR